jgi:hypothetical protein
MLAAFAVTLVLASAGVLAISPTVRMALFGSYPKDTDKLANRATDAETTDNSEVPETKPNELSAPVENDGPFIVMPDDGKLLWASPTQGDAVPLNYVAPGAQLVVVARLADLMNSKEGARVLKALGPEFEQARAQWEETVGLTWQQISQLVLTLHDNGQDVPRAAYVVYLLDPIEEDELVSNWKEARKVEAASSHYYEVGQRAFYVPEAGAGKILVAASPNDIKEVIEFAGAPPALRRELATLLQSSDQDRHVTLVFAPGFLFNNLFRDGRSYAIGEGGEFRRPLEWLLGDELKACLLSFQFDDPFYLEMRAYGQVNHDTPALAVELQSRLKDAPDLIEAHFQEYYPPTYWRRAALRVPQMVRFLHQQTRVGVEDNQAIVNAALPPTAAHNLTFAAKMLMTSPASDPAAVAVAPDVPAAPKTIEELLSSTMNLSFDQKSLEFAMRDLAADVKEAHPTLTFDFQIKILGTDLQLNGITRNQQIADFSASNQTVADVLTSLVMRANPVTTVQNPSDADQKLVWVIGPDPDVPDHQVVLITTRDAAARKSYTLPAPFSPK